MTMMTTMMGQGGGEAAPPAGGELAVAAVIVATTILLFPFFIYQVFIISLPRNKGGVTTGQALVNATAHCCADCGKEGGVSLKACKACMLVKYCGAECQRYHWPTHKKLCKQRAAELRDEALFKDPPPKEDCPICFLPMPVKLICCVSLPPATIKSVPVYDYAEANEELATKAMEAYYSCCGKSICKGCVLSSYMSGNNKKCPFCNADQDKTEGEKVEELMKRVEANDAVAMCVLGSHYIHGGYGLLQDQEKAPLSMADFEGGMASALPLLQQRH